jgi:outer membrane protein
MKASSIAALSLIALLTSARAEGTKIGLVDFQKAVESVDAGKMAKMTLEREAAAQQLKMTEQQQDFQKDAEALQAAMRQFNEAASKAGGTLSKEQQAQQQDLAGKQQELQKRYAELQQAATNTQNALQRRQQELFKPLVDKARTVVSAVGRERGFDLIVDPKGNSVLYTKDAEDVTDAVIARFNATASKPK